MDDNRRTRKRRRRHKLKLVRFLFGIISILICIFIFGKLKQQVTEFFNERSSYKFREEYVGESEIVANAKAEEIDTKEYEIKASDTELEKQLKGLAKDDPDIREIFKNRAEYPDEILTLLVNNSETKQFVLDYPLKKNQEVEIDISRQINKRVPLFLQWDEQWGYSSYGEDIMAINGCGPTSLSMVAVSLLGDTSMNPYWMARYSEENGYASSGATLWTLMSKGASALGLDVTEIPLDKQRVANNLEVGNLIICIMGPGDFTTSGHFIVLTDYEDGMVTINDPNSIERSSKKWAFDEISSQIRNLWVYR